MDKKIEELFIKLNNQGWHLTELQKDTMYGYLKVLLSQAIEEAVKEERKRIIDFINTDEMIDRGDILGLLEEEIE